MLRTVPPLALALLLAFVPMFAAAAQRTACTITVNSPDEREAFRRHLPAGDWRFVELVERGRPDWLASACSSDVRCDVLLVSGHFDGGTEFYSDRVDAGESLPVDELERVACSDACPALFSRLSEVHLYGCNTLNADPSPTASAEIARSFVRAGRSPDEAVRLSAELLARHPSSNRDRMRQLFRGVPVIYGFPSKAPLGRVAGPILERYFQTSGAGEIGAARASERLQRLFAASSMSTTSGADANEAQSASFAAACRLRDTRADAALQVGFVHALLRGSSGELRMLLDRVERFVASLDARARASPAVAQALAAIAADTGARERFLEFARDADEPPTRARMIALAHRLGWLTDEGRRAEIAGLIADRLASPTLGAADVDLACTLRDEAVLAGVHATEQPHGKANAAVAAVRACLGDRAARDALLAAFIAGDVSDVAIAEVYLHRRPIASAEEFRALAAGVARMPSGGAQARALEVLARRPLADADSVARLARLFADAGSLEAQRAIAGILIRSDYRAGGGELLRTLREHRRKSPDGRDVIDVLIRRLAAES